VRFAALLFDEAQKIKTPGVRLTDAAKAMNAAFRVALTGTPVENRLSDLWCIVDTIHPACLGDLRAFSARFEKEPTAEKLGALKRELDHWHGGRAPLLLRRLKEEQLPDLPARTEHIVERPMPPPQMARYVDAIDFARQQSRRGAMLEALQAIRAISLHPEAERGGDDEAFVASSARLTTCFAALDDIASAGDAALIFLDDLAMQARLTGIIQRRYRMQRAPMLINGAVAGHARQARVNQFQASQDGFDVMLLSPRAGGVGLTLTRANHVIHLSRWWNPAVEDQCTGRVLRIGQTRPVSVHLPIAVLPDGRRSFDQNLHGLMERKRALSRDALMPPAETREDEERLFADTVGEG
jgi:SNF2 family DNA or RNA helicase